MPRKTQQNGPLHSFSIAECLDQDLCPVGAMKSYTERTQNFCQQQTMIVWLLPWKHHTDRWQPIRLVDGFNQFWQTSASTTKNLELTPLEPRSLRKRLIADYQSIRCKGSEKGRKRNQRSEDSADSSLIIVNNNKIIIYYIYLLLIINYI